MKKTWTNTDGKISEEAGQELLKEAVTLLTKILKKVSDLSPEEILALSNKIPSEQEEANERIVQLVNGCYQDVLDTEIPQTFLDYLPEFTGVLFRTVFGQIQAKVGANEKLLLARLTGNDRYDDVTVKEIAEAVDKL